MHVLIINVTCEMLPEDVCTAGSLKMQRTHNEGSTINMGESVEIGKNISLLNNDQIKVLAK